MSDNALFLWEGLSIPLCWRWWPFGWPPFWETWQRISEMQGSTYNAMQLLTKFFHIRPARYPSSDSPLTLHAVFSEMEEKWCRIANYTGMIDHVYVTNTFGQERQKPVRVVAYSWKWYGRLRSWFALYPILPNLMIDEVGKAILKPRLRWPMFVNIMTQEGETEHFTDSDHVAVLRKFGRVDHRYCPCQYQSGSRSLYEQQ